MLPSRKTQTGFALPELTIVVFVIAILVTLAVPLFSKAKTQLQRQNVVRELKTYLDRARFDSVKRHPANTTDLSRVVINSATQFTLVSDLNFNGMIDANEGRQIVLPTDGNVKIVGNDLAFPITVTFNFRGQATAVDGLNRVITPTFIVCEGGCTAANATSKNSNAINVSPSGTVTLFDSDKPLATASIANVSTVSAGTKINAAGRVDN